MFMRFVTKKIRGDNMNKVIMTVLIVFGSLISFSYDSSGVAGYDNLNYKKGTFITYVNEDGSPTTDRANAYSYKRAYKGKNGAHIIADFYVSSNSPRIIYTTDKANMVQGAFIKYYEDGKMESKGMYKNGKPDGEITYYDENGNVTQVDKYENGSLVH